MWIFKNRIYRKVKGRGTYVLCTKDGSGPQLDISRMGWRSVRGKR